MNMDNDIKKMDAKIKVLRQMAQELLDGAGDVEAVRRNARRVLASVKMLELNICDLCEMDG